jgi:hypothetical protein
MCDFRIAAQYAMVQRRQHAVVGKAALKHLRRWYEDRRRLAAD